MRINRFISVFLSLAFLSSCSKPAQSEPASSLEESSEPESVIESTPSEPSPTLDVLDFVLQDDNTYGVKAKEGKTPVDVVIPSTYEGKEVKSILDGGFEECSSLLTITFPNTLAIIGSMSFYGCASLKEVSFPSSVTEIAYQAFRSCASIKTVFIPKTVITLGPGLFEGCESLTDVYCEIESQPSTWSRDWYYMCPAEIHWGAIK